MLWLTIILLIFSVLALWWMYGTGNLRNFWGWLMAGVGVIGAFVSEYIPWGGQ